VIVTNDNGFASFSIVPAQTVVAFTATATNENTGDTSEFSACAFVQTPAAPAVSNGLVSWRRAEGNADDSRGINTGTLANGTGFGAGKVGQAFQFDGVDDYVDVSFGFDLDAMTLSAWVFVDPATNTAERPVISKDNFLDPPSGTHRKFVLKSSSVVDLGPNGRPSFEVCVSPLGDQCVGLFQDTVQAPSPLTAGWHHLAGVRDFNAGRFELYVDGTLVASKVPTASGAVDSATHTMLGRGGFFVSDVFQGRIDEAQIFNRGLSTAEVLGLYNIGTSVVTVGSAGAAPFGVAVNTNTGLAYVANRGTSTVSVVDYDPTHPAFGTVIANIFGFFGPLGVTVDTATKHVYVTNEADGGSVSVINADPNSGAFNTVIATLFVGGGASEGISADTSNNHIWLGNYSAFSHTVIDGLIVETPTSPGCGIRGAAVNPVTHRVYFANSWCGGLLIIDGDPLSGSYRTQVGAVSGSSDVKGVAVDVVGNRVFVAGEFGTLSAADGTSGAVLFGMPIGTSPKSVAYSPTTQLVYVTTFDGFLRIVDADPFSLTYHTIIRTQQIGSTGGSPENTRDGGDVASVAVDLARGKVLVTHPRDHAVTIINDAR